MVKKEIGELVIVDGHGINADYVGPGLRMMHMSIIIRLKGKTIIVILVQLMKEKLRRLIK